MKKRLIVRIICITTISLIAGIFITLGMFNYINGATVAENLRQSSQLLISALNYCSNEDEMQELLEKSDQLMFISVFDEDYHILYDSNIEQLNPKYLGDSSNLKKALEKEDHIAFGVPYTNESLMMSHIIKVDNPTFTDSDYVILRSSFIMNYNNASLWISIVVAFFLWFSIIGFVYVASKKSVKDTLEPLAIVENSLEKISKGEYTSSDKPETISDEEMEKIFSRLGDISDRVNTSLIDLQKEQFKSKFLLNNINQGVVAISPIGTVIVFNRSFSDIFTEDEKEDLSGVNIEYIFKGELLETVNKSLYDGIYDMYIMHKESDKQIYRVECIPAENVSNNDDIKVLNIALIMVFTNITEEVETNKIRNEFFANASHELKTPLTAISGYSEILSMNNQTEVVKDKCVNEIRNNATKMKDLINDMMKLSKIDAKIDIEEESYFDLYKVCEDVVREQNLVAINKKVELYISGSESYITARKNMIKVLVENLVSNAIKYNKENGNVKVIVNRTNKYTILQVQDTGIGIPKEHQARLFERFYKVDGARTRTEESSTGLGLSIVQNIVSLHKAQISIESKEGVGTTMTVKFINR